MSEESSSQERSLVKVEFEIDPVNQESTVSSSSEECVIPSLRFPQKLWRIVNECKSSAISWSSSGNSVLIEYPRFQEEFLQQSDVSIFKTGNIASFIRQLNLYGFRKVTSHNRDPAFVDVARSHQDVHEFVHEHFRAGRLDLLPRVCRKTSVKKRGKQTPIKTTYGTGLTKLQECQIKLTMALEQATKQYRKEKSQLQLLEKHISGDAFKPKYIVQKIENIQPNIQIIFQDLSGIQNLDDIPILDESEINSTIDSQGKPNWRTILTLPVENSLPIPMSF